MSAYEELVDRCATAYDNVLWGVFGGSPSVREMQLAASRAFLAEVLRTLEMWSGAKGTVYDREDIYRHDPRLSVGAAQVSQPKARRIKDACAALGIGPSTLYKLARQGKIRLIRIVGRTLVPESEIDRLASEGSPQITPQKSPGL